MHVTRSLAQAPPPTADERRDEGVAEVGRFAAEDGCGPTDWRRVPGRPIESVLPSRPRREVGRSGVAATRAETGRAPVRCDGMACALLVSDDGVAGDLGSTRPRSRDAAACAGACLACGEANGPLAERAGELWPLLTPPRICPFLASNTRRAPLPGVEAPSAFEGVRGLPRKTVSRTTAHLLAACRRGPAASAGAGALACGPEAAAAVVRRLGSLPSGWPQGLLRPRVALVAPRAVPPHGTPRPPLLRVPRQASGGGLPLFEDLILKKRQQKKSGPRTPISVRAAMASAAGRVRVGMGAVGVMALAALIACDAGAGLPALPAASGPARAGDGRVWGTPARPPPAGRRWLRRLGLRGGKRLEEGAGGDTVGDAPNTEGPAADCSDSEPGVTRTVDFGDAEGGGAGGGGSEGSMTKQVLAEGVHPPADGSEYDTGNGDRPQEGDLVSIRITIASAGQQRATTEDLLRLADAGAAGPTGAKTAGSGPVAGDAISPEDACRTPLQQQYAYGGLVRVSQAIEARALQGAYSFRLGSSPDYIVPGIEEAVKEMRRGEVARITVSGDKGFACSGFHGIAREWGIAHDAPAVAEVELVNWNTIDATGDGGVLVTLPHTSAMRVAHMREVGEWRLLERRPSALATVLVRCTLRAVHHNIPGIGNTTTIVFPTADTANTSAEVPPEFSRWVPLGKGELPWGMELAATRTAVAGVPFSVRLKDALYLDSFFGEGSEGREGCGAEAMTYEMLVEDWHEERRLTADGGVLLYQRNVGANYDTVSRPIADGDQVLLDIQGRVLAGPADRASAAGAAPPDGTGAAGAGGDAEVEEGAEWPPWPPAPAEAPNVHEAAARVPSGGAGPSCAQSSANLTGTAPCPAAGAQESYVEMGREIRRLADAGVAWTGGALWPRALRLVTVGNFETASGLERALAGLRVGQHAQVRVYPPYLNTFAMPAEGGTTGPGAPFGPPGSPGLEFSFTVTALRPATRCSLRERLELAARRRALGNDLFAAGKFEDALAVYRLGADLVFHWRVAVTEDVDEDGGGLEDLMSPYDKERLRRASEHMNPDARKKYLDDMRKQQLERQRRRRRRRRTTVAEATNIDGAWEGPEVEGGENDVGAIREAGQLRRLCLVNAALCLLKLKRPADAKAECDAVLRDDDTNLRAYHRRCRAFLDLNQLSLAEADLEMLEVLRRREQAREGAHGAQEVDIGEAETLQPGSSSSGSGAKWKSEVSEQDVERLRVAVKRAAAQHHSTDKQLYSKMFSRKRPPGNHAGARHAGGGGGPPPPPTKLAAEREAGQVPGRKEDGGEGGAVGGGRAGAREKGTDCVEEKREVGRSSQAQLRAVDSEGKSVGTEVQKRQKTVVDRAVFVGGPGGDDDRLVLVRNAQVSPEEEAAARQNEFDREVCG